MSKWFVVMRNYYGKPVPLVDWIGDEPTEFAATFDTEAEADAAGRSSMFGNAYGWETYEWSER